MTDGSPACARSALRASGYRASATFGDGLADDRRRGAGRSRSRPQDSHGQEQTCRASEAVARTRIRAGGLQRPGQAVYPGQGRRSARHQDHTRESFRRAASGTAQAELVALWIGQDVPVLVPLADVDLSRAKGEQPVELGLLVAVDGLDVQVQPVPGGLRSVRPNRKSISNGFLQPRSTRHSCRGSQPASPALRPRTARAARRPPRRRPGKRSGFPRARASTSWAQ